MSPRALSRSITWKASSRAEVSPGGAVPGERAGQGLVGERQRLGIAEPQRHRVLLLAQALGPVERGQPIGASERELPQPERHPRAEHQRARLLVVSPGAERVLDGRPGHLHGLLRPGRVGGRQELGEREPRVHRGLEGATRQVTLQRRAEQGEGFLGRAEQHRELHARGEVADPGGAEGNAGAFLDSGWPRGAAARRQPGSRGPAAPGASPPRPRLRPPPRDADRRGPACRAARGRASAGARSPGAAPRDGPAPGGTRTSATPSAGGRAPRAAPRPPWRRPCRPRRSPPSSPRISATCWRSTLPEVRASSRVRQSRARVSASQSSRPRHRAEMSDVVA